jgi:hypothetical protein
MFSKYVSGTETTPLLSTVKTKLLLSIIATAMVAAAVTISTPAKAGDQKSFPGAMCRAQGAQDNPNLSVSSHGTISNMSTTSSLKVDCPIVQDFTHHELTTIPNPGSLLGSTITVDDKHPTQDVICQFRLHDQKGQSLGVDNTVRSQGTNPPGGFQDLFFPPVNVVLPTFSKTYYHINCTLPPAIINSNGTLSTSGVKIYGVSEGGNTDF